MASFQSDFEAQIRSQESVINSLRNELEILNNTNTDKSQESVEVNEQTQGVKIEISEKDGEIRELHNSIASTVMQNQGVERENDNVKHSISSNQELRHTQQSTIYQNNGALSKWE